MSTTRQSRVEHGLVAALQIAGRPAATFSLAERMQRYGVPGVSMAVVHDGEVAWAAGYGTAQATTLFQAASISKAVAAVAVLALVEAGDLELDTDVNRFLRSWQLPPSEHTEQQPVTLRHLLSHTAGTTVPGFPGYPVGAPVPAVADVLSGAGGANTPAVESFARPGTVAQYSGGGTTVVQQMVVDVTGRSFESLVDDLVLTPFGMVDSAYQQPLATHRQHRAAVGHTVSGAPVPGGFHVYPELQAAGLWTTAIDLARWIAGVQRLVAGWRGGPISPEMAVQMVTPVGLGPFGLGPELGGEGAVRRFGHSGANEGFRSQMDGLVERPVGGVVLTNADNGTTLCAEVRKAFAAEYGWGELGAPPIELADVPAEVLQGYAGRYRGPFGRPLRLEFHDGELFSPAPYGRRLMLPLGPTTFLDEETGATLEVERAEGAVQRIAVLVDGAELMAFEPEGSE
jgi:CubicO group peptidase (beta-lactamase class C family)